MFIKFNKTIYNRNQISRIDFEFQRYSGYYLHIFSDSNEKPLDFEVFETEAEAQARQEELLNLLNA